MNTKALVAQLLATITPDWFLKYLSMLVSELGAGHVIVINALLAVLADQSPEKHAVRIWAVRKLSLHLGEKNVAEAFVRRLVNERRSNPFVDTESKEGDLDWKVAAYLRKAHHHDAVSSALYAAAKDYSNPKLAAAAYRMVCRIYLEKFHSTSDTAQSVEPDIGPDPKLDDFMSEDPACNNPRSRYLQAIVYPFFNLHPDPKKAEQFTFWALQHAIGKLVEDPKILPNVLRLVNADRHRLRIAAAMALKPVVDRKEVQQALLTGLLIRQPNEQYSIENPEDIGNARTFDSNSLRRVCIEALAPYIRESNELQRKVIDSLFCETPGQYAGELGKMLEVCFSRDDSGSRLGAQFDNALLSRVLQRNELINENGKSNLVALLRTQGLESYIRLLRSLNPSVQEIGLELIGAVASYTAPENILPQLVKLVPQVEPTPQAGLVAAIGKIFGPRATDFLFSQLTAEDPQLRRAALRALIAKGVSLTSSEINQLIPIVRSDIGEVASLAIKLLGYKSEAEETLISIAKDSKAPSAARVAAVVTLGRGAWGTFVTIDHSGLKGLTALEKGIAALVIDPMPEIRIAAIRQLPGSDNPRSAALIRGTRKLVNKLLCCATGKNVDVAVEAINKLRPIAADDNVAAVLAKLAHHDNEEIAIAAMSALAQSGVSPDLLQP